VKRSSLDKTKAFIKPGEKGGDKGSDAKKRGSVVLEGLLEVSHEQNKLLKGHHKLNRVDTALNIKGKNLQLYKEIRKALARSNVHCRHLKMDQGTRAMTQRPSKPSSPLKSSSVRRKMHFMACRMPGQ
jgi:hypothetical protein